MQNTNVQIVRLRPGDHSLLASSAEGLLDGPVSMDELEALLREPNALLFMAVAGSRGIGLAGGYVLRRTSGTADLHVNELIVEASWRRQGIGARLFEALAAAGQAAGAGGVWLLVDPGDPSALRFYRSFGLITNDGRLLSARF
jgi:ribosomal protein S18 acetylase RimI-like enzyme